MVRADCWPPSIVTAEGNADANGGRHREAGPDDQGEQNEDHPADR